MLNAWLLASALLVLGHAATLQHHPPQPPVMPGPVPVPLSPAVVVPASTLATAELQHQKTANSFPKNADQFISRAAQPLADPGHLPVTHLQQPMILQNSSNGSLQQQQPFLIQDSAHVKRCKSTCDHVDSSHRHCSRSPESKDGSSECSSATKDDQSASSSGCTGNSCHNNGNGNNGQSCGNGNSNNNRGPNDGRGIGRRCNCGNGGSNNQNAGSSCNANDKRCGCSNNGDSDTVAQASAAVHGGCERGNCNNNGNRGCAGNSNNINANNCGNNEQGTGNGRRCNADGQCNGGSCQRNSDSGSRTCGSSNGCNGGSCGPSGSGCTGGNCNGNGCSGGQCNGNSGNEGKCDENGNSATSTTSSSSCEAVPKFGVEVSDEAAMEAEMNKLDDWGCIDIFKVAELTYKKPVVAVTYTIMQRRGVLSRLNIDPGVFVKYMVEIESLYSSTIAYHNGIHAADIAQSAHALLLAPALQGVFDDLEIFAAIFAAAIHDVGHFGLTNRFLVKNGSDLAIIYNDRSPLENMHAATAFRLLERPELNFTAGFANTDDKRRFRKIVIQSVLGTDLGVQATRRPSFETLVENRKLDGFNKLIFPNETQKDRVLEAVVHTADLSNPAKPLASSKKWAGLLLEQMAKQGEEEAKLNLPYCELCRPNVNLNTATVKFIDAMVMPQYILWSKLVEPAADSIVSQLSSNLDHYKENSDGVSTWKSQAQQSSGAQEGGGPYKFNMNILRPHSTA